MDFEGLSRVRMMMKVVDQTGEAVGGRVVGGRVRRNRDLEKVVGVKGDEWFGHLEVG